MLSTGTPRAAAIFPAVTGEHALPHRTAETVTRDTPDFSASRMLVMSLRAISAISLTRSIRNSIHLALAFDCIIPLSKAKVKRKFYLLLAFLSYALYHNKNGRRCIMTIGERIREIRKSRGLTQKELGERLGLSYQSIAQWENDLRKPKSETILKIACALGVRYEDIVGLETFNSGAEFDKRRNEIIEELRKSDGKTLKIIHVTDPIKFINHALDQMTEEGQAQVAQRAAEVLEVPRYRKDELKD
jgi:transcriptional regulator with XRE-family HTH domain